MTDWSKAVEVFVSGVLGVYLIMGLLLVVTKLGLKVTAIIEGWASKPASPPQQQ
jgi:hypothetical protein